METVVVVQWEQGYVEVSDGGTGRVREVAWPAGDIQTAAAATAVGTAALQTLGVRDSVSIGAEAWPAWPVIGDGHSVSGFDGTPSLQRVIARRVDIDANGYAKVTPTFSSPEAEATTRTRLAIETMTTGPAGRSAGMSAQSALAKTVPTGVLSPPRIPDWSTAGGIDVSTGARWRAESATIVTRTELLCTGTGPPTDAVAMQLVIEGYSTNTFSLPASSTSKSWLGQIAIPAGAVARADVSSIGSNTVASLEDMILTLRLTAANAAMRVDVT